MAQQIDDQQYYAIKACLERAHAEIQEAYKVMYGTGHTAPNNGAQQTKPNPGGKTFNAPTPPTVTKDHQAAVDAANPEIQAQLAAGEKASSSAMHRSIGPEVTVVSASANGSGDYFAIVQCENTKQQASIPICEDEYEELQTVSIEDEVVLELDQEQIDDAEWEPLRGVSTDPMAQCNCGGNVPNTNPYSDPKIDAEIACGHTRKCAFWDFNTITYDQNSGGTCQVSLDQYDKSATYGFDIYKNNRDAMLARAADPNDNIVLVDDPESDSGEFGLNIQLANVGNQWDDDTQDLIDQLTATVMCSPCGNDSSACTCDEEDDE